MEATQITVKLTGVIQCEATLCAGKDVQFIYNSGLDFLLRVAFADRLNQELLLKVEYAIKPNQRHLFSHAWRPKLTSQATIEMKQKGRR